ncbi:MAG: U32 family peptidase [Eubacterium sp.]|nr:U32 family peptidase [Eubacterium sp.]
MESNKQNSRPELLLPAGNLENLRTAIQYGADAVYLGGKRFGLRAKADNFTVSEMAEGVAYAHAHQAKVYLTVNIFAHNRDLEGLREYFTELKGIPLDALLISDPGVFMLAKEMLPEIPIHISTQANNTNYLTWEFWKKLGAERVVAARELSLAEIGRIAEELNGEMEIEAFVHGAMCISYSGRCLLSAYFTGRDANQGACTHPCRWKYALKEKADQEDHCQEGDAIESSSELYLEEESRPGEYLPIEEDERGTYILNSKDLCMIEHIPEMVKAGIASFKIEGRMKTALYVAVTASVYRRAIDDFFSSEELYRQNIPEYKREIGLCTTREFSTGFYFGHPDETGQIYSGSTYRQGAVYLGTVAEVDPEGRAVIYQKNKFSVGDELQIMPFRGGAVAAKVLSIRNEDGMEVDSAPHPMERLSVALRCREGLEIMPGMLLRRIS